jgi:peptide-methionine (R)-S-oxide reductase
VDEKGPMKNTSEEDWREILTQEEYHVLREKGTEAPFSGKHLKTEGEGTFTCAGCGSKLFDSSTKFKSGTGWPSFMDVIEGCVDLCQDMNRIEATCSNCGGHLGHVFDDGPKPTGKRYCINSLSLNFE